VDLVNQFVHQFRASNNHTNIEEMNQEQLENMDEKITEKESDTIGSDDKDRQMQAECPICLLDIEPGVDCCLTNCSFPHAFHTSCLIRFAAQPRHRYQTVSCPLCCTDLFKPPDVHSIVLLSFVTRKDWDGMIEYQRANPTAKFDAIIEPGDYPDHANIGMTALHFAIRDHAPLVRIKQILEGYPAARSMKECSGARLTPYDFLSEVSTNGESWTEQEYSEVKDYLFPQDSSE